MVDDTPIFEASSQGTQLQAALVTNDPNTESDTSTLFARQNLESMKIPKTVKYKNFNRGHRRGLW